MKNKNLDLYYHHTALQQRACFISFPYMTVSEDKDHDKLSPVTALLYTLHILPTF